LATYLEGGPGGPGLDLARYGQLAAVLAQLEGLDSRQLAVQWLAASSEPGSRGSGSSSSSSTPAEEG
jgi:hypothetical protein